MSRVKTAFLMVLGLIWLAPVYLLVVNASKSVDGYDAKTVWKPAGFSLFSNFGDAWSKAALGDACGAEWSGGNMKYLLASLAA